ncbi:MAG: hypothetical protein ABGZ35_03545 [Planctomycetaceae bacterium]
MDDHTAEDEPMTFAEWTQSLGVDLHTVSRENESVLEVAFDVLQMPVASAGAMAELVARHRAGIEADLAAHIANGRKMSAQHIRQKAGIVSPWL